MNTSSYMEYKEPENIEQRLSSSADISFFNVPDAKLETLAVVATSSLNIEIDKKKASRAKSNANLKPCKPGERVPGAGKPKGAISLKARIMRALDADNANEVAKTIINMAKEGNLAAAKLLLELKGEYSSSPNAQVNIQQNSTNITTDVANLARQMLIQDGVLPPDTTIIDVQSKQIEDAEE